MQVIKNSFIYTAVRIIKNGIGLFLLPVYTVYLTTADYGVVSVVTSFVSFLSILILFSLNGAGVRFHYDYAGDKAALRSFWGTIYTFVMISGVVTAGLLTAGHLYLIDPFFGEVPFFPYLFLGILICCFQSGYSIYQAYLRADQQGGRFGANDMAFFILKTALTLVFIVAFELSALGIILALAVTHFAFMVAAHFSFTPVIALGIDRAKLKQSLAYGIPMMPHALAGFAMTLIDRMFLVNLKSASDVGIYTIGFQIASVLHMASTAANQAYSPWFYQKCKEGDAGIRKIQEFSEFLVIAFAVMGLMLALFSKEVLELFVTEDFEAGWLVTPFLVFAYVFHGLYYVIVGPIFLERVRILPIITVSSALLNIALNYLMIPPFGIIGASLATMITMMLSALVTLAVGIRVKDMGYRWRRMLLVCFGGTALSMIVFLDSYMTWWTHLAVKLAAALVVAVLFVYKYRAKGMQFLKTLRRQ